jgi:hypothetical protein
MSHSNALDSKGSRLWFLQAQVFPQVLAQLIEIAKNLPGIKAAAAVAAAAAAVVPEPVVEIKAGAVAAVAAVAVTEEKPLEKQQPLK